MRTHGGKGSKQRPGDKEKFEANYDTIFSQVTENKEELLKEQVIDSASEMLTNSMNLMRDAMTDGGFIATHDARTVSLEHWDEILYFLDNIQLYDYPAQEGKDLLKRIT